MSENVAKPEQASGQDNHNLHADCENCFGLCCVALPFAASADFACDKDAGEPCINLKADFRCGVHNNLRQLGFRGCTVYDCFGAGQKISQVTFGGIDWRQAPETAKSMFESFPIMRQLHEILWYLSEALTWAAASPIQDDLRNALNKTELLTQLNRDALIRLDVAAHRADVSPLLIRASELVRDSSKHRQKNAPKQQKSPHRKVDFFGAMLKGADLRAADLRGAYFIGANLRGADLRAADLLGADFRDADLGGADLSDCLYLIQSQLNAAKGNTRTKLPSSLTRPAHWLDN